MLELLCRASRDTLNSRIIEHADFPLLETDPYCVCAS